MTRTTQWVKFSVLGAIALLLALAFASAVNFPERSDAQQTARAIPVNTAAPLPGSRGVTDLSDAFADVVELVRPSVVYISAEQRARPREQAAPNRLPPPLDQFFEQPRGPRRGSGSGFILSSDGYILTNNHVVEGADRLQVKLFDKRVFNATVVGRDPDTDVAVIKIDASKLPQVPTGNSDSVRVGEWVLAVGNPLGEEFSFTVTAGIVSSKGRSLRSLVGDGFNIQDFIQTDAAINPGNSGGPLVNIHGQIIGINSAIASQTGYYQGYGFAIPINLVRNVAEQLIRDGKVTRAQLGVSIREVTPEDAEAVGLQTIRGVLVNDFTNNLDSPAKAAGIQPGDVIVRIDGHEVDYVAQLQQMIRFRKPGERVKVTVRRRGGEEKDITVRLTASAAEETAVAPNPQDTDADNITPAERSLGIDVQTIDPQSVPRELGLTGERLGLMVTNVDPEGPADRRLIAWERNQPGDVITQVNGARVRTEAEFSAALRGVKAGDIVELQVVQPGGSASRFVRLRAQSPQ